MLSTESPKFDLPEELLQALPSDPFEQLDVARKITSIALSARVDALESEVSVLQQQLADRDTIISGLESQLQSLDASLNEASDKLSLAQQEKESLMKENAQLSIAVKKLNRDVAKLETFRKTLMRSLQEDEDKPAIPPKTALPLPPTNSVLRPRVPQAHTSIQTSTPRLTPPGSPPSLSATVSPSRTPGANVSN
ncbi:UNVERIFIED_CONTAM: hypothetical protein Sradi_2754500 [Sesamum radiatum]|uniref:Uncharacterized protein n=1 Tax=Sesamum radiatum TaxID=300843 RepID=A0AAW2S871_SESRA